MNTIRGFTTVGTTFGLAATSCSKGEAKAEQVYVRTGDDAHPVEIDAWVGYSSIGRMRLTRAQARELIPLLVTALAQTELDPVESVE